MTRTFDASGKLPDDVVDALTVLDHHLRQRGIRYVLVGALARDLVTSLPQGRQPERATKDVDIAIRVSSMREFEQAMEGLARIGRHEHKFRVAGVEVDVIPFGDLAEGGHVSFAESVLDVRGLDEADSGSDQIRLKPDLVVGSASVAALAVLKILAYRDRHEWTTKDAVDLNHLFSSIDLPPYASEAWDDAEAGELVEYDGSLIGAAWLGRQASLLSTEGSRGAVLDALDVHGDDLSRDMRDQLGRERLDAFTRAFAHVNP